MVNRNAQLAIAALIELAKTQMRMSAVEIAEKAALSQPSIAKVLSTLRQGNFIVSIPGPGGGFTLSRSPEDMNVLDICNFFELQTAMPDHCVITCSCSDDAPCRVCGALQGVDDLRDSTLRDITIASLAA
ncbi:MAG: Rrf2 family transcriptional regulator [Phycisphaerales bacterium]|nr:Rrf2 family transcriptional regulator [Planctomycetota bacterium]MBL6998096.1 Rrf2 family transcriptional regulator [Phycisphaerales bacterium]